MDNLQHIGSSNIWKAGYDKNTRTLSMIFLNRKSWEYTYYNVGIKTWVKFLQSESRGKYFADFIKDVFPYKKTIVRK